ncbi:MAG: glycosyltransferase [Methylococcales bacterium]
MKKVTVIVPAYNAAQYVSAAIDSVLGQTYKNIEVIVVDDGSTDQTEEVVRRYGHQVRYIRQDNGGPSKARNTGIRAADSKLLAILDADDVWLPEKILAQVDLLEENPDLDLVFCDAELIDEDGRSYGSVWKQRGCYEAMVAESRRLAHPFATIMMMDCILPSAVLVRRTCLDRAGLFDESLRYTEHGGVEDKDLMLRIALTSEMGCVPRVLMKRLRHGYSHSQVENVCESVIFVVRRMQQLYPEQFVSEHIDTARLLAPTYYQLGRCYLDQDKLRAARRAFWESLRLRLSRSALGFWAVTLTGLITIRLLRRLKKIAVGRPVCQTSE